MLNEPNFEPKSPNVNIGKNWLAAVVLISFIVGAAGGVVGNIYLSRLPSFQKLLPAAGQQGASQKITLNEDSAIVDVVKKASSAVVSIVISKDLSKFPGFGLSPFNFFYDGGQSQPSSPNIQQVGAGSGFFVSADGLILTNKHVVSDSAASYTVITQDGKSYPAKVMSQDPISDLAIVKVDIKNAPYLALADSNNLQVGQRVIAIGNSLGQYQNTVTTGIVSGIGRSITAGGLEGSENLEGVVQTDAAINPGNSGGPLLNVAAQVIGINTAIDQQGQSVGFAIPSNDIQKALASFQKNGRITRAYLGVRYVNITKALADQRKLAKSEGALLVSGNSPTEPAVIPGSPADKAGLQENDIILKVNGKNVDQDNSLSKLLKPFNVGDSVTLRVYHNGSEKDVKVTLEETK